MCGWYQLIVVVLFVLLLISCFVIGNKPNETEEFVGDFDETLIEKTRAILRDESPNWKYDNCSCGCIVHFKKRNILFGCKNLEIRNLHNGQLGIYIEEWGVGCHVASVEDEECMRLYEKYCNEGKSRDEQKLLKKL